jgi:hypothetical protein
LLVNKKGKADMKYRILFLQFLLIGLLVFTTTAQAAGGTTGAYQVGFQLWQGADFSGWTKAAILTQADGSLALDYASATPGSDPAGAYNGRNFYNGGSYRVGEATSPLLSTFAFQQAIASWTAATPTGTWIEIQVRARFGTRTSKWYNLGVWASGDTTIQRHSVNSQGDADASVSTDTLVIASAKVPSNGLQIKVRLFSADPAATPVVRSLSVSYSTALPTRVTPSTGNPALWNTLLAVPECSQMVYPDGGNRWCSPTSTSMVLGYWGIDPGDCEPRVRAAVAGVYDWTYGAYGNWPFNTAYAASRSSGNHPLMEGYVRRFTSLSDLESWLKAGVPVVMSIAWKKDELTGAPIPSSSGHLVTLVGFDGTGQPIVNDPAAASNGDVQRTYLRSQLESVWLRYSGGTAYLIFPQGYTHP